MFPSSPSSPSSLSSPTVSILHSCCIHPFSSTGRPNNDFNPAVARATWKHKFACVFLVLALTPHYRGHVKCWRSVWLLEPPVTVVFSLFCTCTHTHAHTHTHTHTHLDRGMSQLIEPVSSCSCEITAQGAEETSFSLAMPLYYRQLSHW